MLAPQGLAEALRQGGPGITSSAPTLEMKDIRKEAKKRDKRATLSAKDFERKKEKEEREREKKEKEAERERERKEKEERKRKEREEKEALKAKEREEKEAARLNSSVATSAVSPATPASPSGVTLATYDTAAQPLADSWEKKGGSKRRTILFGKKDSQLKGGSGIGEQAVRYPPTPIMTL
jgi:outer membrane biosynthesis protein TonB